MYELKNYDFELPEERIAQKPVDPRDHSRLMVLDRSSGSIEHRLFRDLPEYLNSQDVLVANNSQVIRARLLGHRLKPDGTQGGKVEFFLLERHPDGIWEGLMHASARTVTGFRFEIPCRDRSGMIGEVVQGLSQQRGGTVFARFDRDPVEAGAGEVPIPPYVQRSRESEDDAKWYTTLYAKEPGSAAAPTAGFHFTESLMNQLRARGVGWEEITLHVGLGTFRPVKVNDIRQHLMHEERYWVSDRVAHNLNQARRSGKRIVAVGTTSCRTLESSRAQDGQIQPGEGRTRLFLYPRSEAVSEFGVVDRLITNFHLPRSSLLMLVCAFAGTERVMHAYQEAIRLQYRFYSYGDAMLIL